MYILKHKTENLFLNRSTRLLAQTDINKASTYLDEQTAMRSLIELRQKIDFFLGKSFSEFKPFKVILKLK
jgi:hypothetical protein